MTLVEVTRDAVLAAIKEYDDGGRRTFLHKYGFGEAREYELLHDGRRYDSKAIVGVAHRYATGVALRSGEFTGGVQSVVRLLERLGFEVVQRSSDLTDLGDGRLSASLERVLQAASAYSSTDTPAMTARTAAARDCAEVIRESLSALTGPLDKPDLYWRTEVGGRRADYSPVPWIRISSPDHSPHATEGFYLVYLFAADGSRVYLSLNQGTSESGPAKCARSMMPGVWRARRHRPAAAWTTWTSAWWRPGTSRLTCTARVSRSARRVSGGSGTINTPTSGRLSTSPEQSPTTHGSSRTCRRCCPC